MRTAVIGAGGQLGADLVARLGADAVPLDHRAIEITDPGSIAAAFDRHAFDAVINCAAFNRVDDAEQSPEAAFQVNTWGPLNLARACQARGCPLLHLSTDYVFGLETSPRPWRESDPTAPVNVYGVSKLAGEQMVRMTCSRHFVVRTCGLYGRAAGSKGNFVRTIRRLASQKSEIRVVNDQRCTPTSTADLAGALVDLVGTDAWGAYHITNGGDCTWFEFATAIVEVLKLPVRIEPTTSAEFPRPARRPGYSVLDCTKAGSLLGRTLRPWREALADHLTHEP